MGKICDDSETAQSDPPFVEAALPMQAAVLNGLRDDLSAHQMWLTSQQCPTGNCTWPAHTSLGICSKCADVKDRLVKHETPKGVDQIMRSPPSVFGFEDPDSALILPNGVYLNNVDGKIWSGNYSSTIRFNAMSSGGSTSTQKSIVYGNISTLIWTQSIIRVVPPLAPQPPQPWPESDLEAKECILYWCAQDFNTSMVNGQPVEYVKFKGPEDVNRDPDSWEQRNNHVYGVGPMLSEAQIASLAYDACVSKKVRTDLRLEREFNVSQAAVLSTSLFVQKTLALPDDFGGPATDLTGDTMTDVPSYWWYNGYYIVSSMETHDSGPPPMQSLARTKSLEDKFSHLAYSMTNSIRSTADDTPKVKGMTGYMRIIIVVHWQWIVLPALVWILTVAQVALAVSVTKQSGAPIWKSSALALVSRSGKCADVMRGKDKISELHDSSKRHRVDLFRDREDARLMMVRKAGGGCGECGD